MDLDGYLGRDFVYMRVSNPDKKDPQVPGDAFLERFTLYGVYGCEKVLVKIEGVEGKTEAGEVKCKCW